MIKTKKKTTINRKKERERERERDIIHIILDFPCSILLQCICVEFMTE